MKIMKGMKGMKGHIKTKPMPATKGTTDQG